MLRVKSPALRGVTGVALAPLAVVVAAAGGIRTHHATHHASRAGAEAPPGVVAYIIPQQQPDQASLLTLLGVLADRGVEIRRALAPFASGRLRYSAGAVTGIGKE